MTSAPAPAPSSVRSRLPDPRTAVVTGAGGPAGIGRVTARLLAESGWHIALVDINADGLAGVEKELRGSGSRERARTAERHRLRVLGDRDVSADRLRTASGRRLGQPGRDRLSGAAARMQSGGIRAGDGGERHGFVSDAQGGRRADDPAGCRTHRQHVVDHRHSTGAAHSPRASTPPRRRP